jgi:hypothetical protein
MSQIVRKVNSVNINSFETGYKEVPVDLNAAQSEHLKQNLQPLFNALIQDAIFKKIFTNALTPASTETSLNITLADKTIIVSNKNSRKTSRFSISQDPENAPLNAIITRIFKIAENVLPNKEEPLFETVSGKAFSSRTESQTPIEKMPEPDLLDVSQLSETSQPLEKGPLENLFIPSSSNAPSHIVPKNAQTILNLYDTPAAPIRPPFYPLIPQKLLNQDPCSLKSQFHFKKDGAPKSERPYLEDLFYDLPDNPPKKEERETLKHPEKHTALSDLNAFEYLQKLERLENQKQLAIQADLTVTSST